ncbi:thiol-disulfide oxidoreductase DCC family protein [Kiritimatiella glycovorans]|uniref:DUF393 domain-containing protein n=1 Tax=Kiritimatiella glycovorans TaxID=1307763 RepID=A0A0G3EGZ2_9BACT|nr:DUF393 domain-containing protein [Kiritimatiella glycovorans]AKJ64075.1 hypothetical protein L21SP4_00812 [Kiritimatiella glycovorans]
MLTILYDGQCPICRAAVRRLQRRDHDAALSYINIRDEVFDAADWGLRKRDVESVLHAVGPQGRVWRGFDAVREAGRATGARWVALSELPVLRSFCEMLYRLALLLRSRLTAEEGRE